MEDKYTPPFMIGKTIHKSTSKTMHFNSRQSWQSKYDAEKAQVEREKKEKEDAQARALENNDTNFPALGGGGPSTKPGWTGKSFAALATSWKETADANKESAAIHEDHHEFSLPTFKVNHNYVEEEDDEMPELSAKPPTPSDEWIEVKKVHRQKKEKTLDEKFPDPDGDHEDETVWRGDQPAEHETCWDEKKY